jgi:hypothetical protein
MFDTVFGLPVHVLVIHAVVVLVPLACVGVLAYALVPRWRGALRWPVLVVATAGAISTPIAYLSGNEFRERLSLEGSEAVQRHADFGLRALIAVLVWWVLVVVVLGALARSGSPSRLGLVVVAVVSLATLGGVVVTGHSGSEAVWGPIVANT